MPSRKEPEVTNQSRAAGAPAPASVAATAPVQSGFYAAPEETPPGATIPQAVAQTIFTERARTDAVEVAPETTADPEVAGAADARDGETLEQAIARVRGLTTRKLGSFNLKLALPKRQHYARHWFNDHPGRVDEALANGWTHIKKDGVPIKRVVGSGRDKGALYAYAMEIPEVFRQEELNARHAQAAAKMEALQSAPFRAPAGSATKQDAGKFYSPTEEAPLSVVKG